MRKRGIRYTIPHRSNEKRKGAFNKELYRERNKVERLFSRLKEFRRIATRYEKRAANYAAMLTIAAIFSLVTRVCIHTLANDHTTLPIQYSLPTVL